MSQNTEFRFTGWHALGVFGGAFAVIISVNVALAVNAVRTFPGLETRNSYIASQTFEDRRAAQEALGWQVSAGVSDGVLRLAITDAEGRAVQAGTLDAVLARPTHARDDRAPDFAFDGRAYVAREALAPGAWTLRVTATALNGQTFVQRVPFHVSNPDR